MVSSSHFLCLLLLPLLAHVAADQSDDQVVAEVMSHSQEDTNSGSSERHLLSPNAIPHSLLLQLLRSGSLLRNNNNNNNNDDENNNNDFLPSPGSSNNGGEGEGSYDVNEGLLPAKRVFCNGFTGCGGRHRDRSRRQEMYGKRLIPLLVKRPFCNSFGCYNGKRSGPAVPGLVNPAVASLRMQMLARAMAAKARGAHKAGPGEAAAAAPAGASVLMGRLGSRGKRLICNGFGGCMGGKRSLFSPWMSKMNAVAADLR